MPVETSVAGESSSEGQISCLRRQIDGVDVRLLSLLSQRQSLSRQLGLLKKELGLEPLQLSRQQEKLAALRLEGRRLGLDDAVVDDFYDCLHSLSLSVQQK